MEASAYIRSVICKAGSWSAAIEGVSFARKHRREPWRLRPIPPPMARESNASTPLILWICAAVCAHYMFAEGGGEVAKTYEDHSFIEQMGLAARDRVTRAGRNQCLWFP